MALYFPTNWLNGKIQKGKRGISVKKNKTFDVVMHQKLRMNCTPE